jgi:hypothetical protein
MKRKPLYVAALCCLLVIVSAIAGAQNRVLARPSSVGAVTFTPLLPSDMPPVDRRLPKECVVAADGSIVVAESGARSPHSTDDAFDSLDALAMSLLDPLGQAGFIRLSQVQGAFIGRVAYDGGTTGLWSVANTTTTKKFFVETGTGSAGAAPDWETIVGNDIAALSVDWTGQHQFSRTPTSGVLNAWDLWMSSTPYATSLAAMVEMGTNFDGSTSGHYNANSGGQFLGINAPAAWSGDFVNFQNQGNAEFSVGIGGTVVANGLTLSGFGTGIAHVNSSGAFSSSALVASEIPNPAGDVGGTYAATSVNAMTMTNAGVVTLALNTISQPGAVATAPNDTTKFWRGDGSWAVPPSGTGTVTSLAVGDLSPLFTTSVATSTTTPVLSFSLTNAAQNSIFAGPSSGGTGAPSYRAMVPLDIAASAAAGKLPYASSSTVLAWSAAGADTNTIRYVGTVPTPDSYLQNTGAQVSVGAAPLEANTEFTVLGAGGSSAPQVARFIDNVSGSNPVTIQVNNTTNGKGAEIGVIGATDNFFTGTAQGDAIVRQTGGSGAMWFGSAATAFMKMSSTLIAPQVATAPKVVTVTASSNTYTINASLGNQFRCTLAATNTIAAPTNPTDGERILVELIQDGTGSRTVTWNAAFVFGTDVASPTLSTAANKKDYVGFVYNTNSAKWHALAVARGY